MRVLHTSDWHIGRSLYGQKRYTEFFDFFNWLLEFINQKNVDVLLVSGDIFDTSTPSNHAQKLYYQFLTNVSASCCRHVVIISGNHDSPSFLNAPRQLLKMLNIHIVSTVSQDMHKEILVLKNSADEPEAIVCAVPYLRDRDVRHVQAGESNEDKNKKLIQGIKNHYTQIGKKAVEEQKKCGPVPIIGMGHLFAAGGKTMDGDGVRELYVGSLAHVGKDVFPSCMDYVALGHLHVPQTVAGCNFIRYPGSPLPMGYGESRQKKKVIIVDFQGEKPKITAHGIPCFQKLVRITGSVEAICREIEALKDDRSSAWLEIEYTGTKIAANLRQLVEDAVEDTDMKVLRIKNRRLLKKVMTQVTQEELLENLDEQQVFERLLSASAVEDKERPGLLSAYNEIIKSMDEADMRAE